MDWIPNITPVAAHYGSHLADPAPFYTTFTGRGSGSPVQFYALVESDGPEPEAHCQAALASLRRRLTNLSGTSLTTTINGAFQACHQELSSAGGPGVGVTLLATRGEGGLPGRRCRHLHLPAGPGRGAPGAALRAGHHDRGPGQPAAGDARDGAARPAAGRDGPHLRVRHHGRRQHGRDRRGALVEPAGRRRQPASLMSNAPLFLGLVINSPAE